MAAQEAMQKALPFPRGPPGADSLHGLFLRDVRKHALPTKEKQRGFQSHFLKIERMHQKFPEYLI